MNSAIPMTRKNGLGVATIWGDVGDGADRGLGDHGKTGVHGQALPADHGAGSLSSEKCDSPFFRFSRTGPSMGTN